MPEYHHLALPAAVQKLVYRTIDIISVLGLVCILLATVVAISQEILLVWAQQQVKLADLLLMFIYMEVIAMVGIYFHSHRLPVRFPVLIAMVALARHIILETGTLSKWELVAMAGAIFVLGLTTVLLKYGNRFDAYEKEGGHGA
jgi:protein PsiE